MDPFVVHGVLERMSDREQEDRGRPHAVRQPEEDWSGEQSEQRREYRIQEELHGQ